jgi:ankyrin repeat protein
LERGADPNSKARDRETPLIRASRNNNVEVVNLLKRAGAKP